MTRYNCLISCTTLVVHGATGAGKIPTVKEYTTFERICDIIRDNGGTADMELTPETKLADAGLDSLATVEAVIACEDEFDIEIETDSNPETVGEFVELVESLMEN